VLGNARRSAALLQSIEVMRDAVTIFVPAMPLMWLRSTSEV
jgi:hypothetical protein